MARSSSQRAGDVTLLLAAVGVLTLLSRLLAATDVGDNAGSFWSYVGLTVTASLWPAFAGACAACWMDPGRRPIARAALLALFGMCAVCVLGDVAFGRGSFSGGRSANFMQDAASLLMIAGGVTLVAGVTPLHDG